jgi:hypothetical protein
MNKLIILFMLILAFCVNLNADNVKLSSDRLTILLKITYLEGKIIYSENFISREVDRVNYDLLYLILKKTLIYKENIDKLYEKFLNIEQNKRAKLFNSKYLKKIIKYYQYEGIKEKIKEIIKNLYGKVPKKVLIDLERDLIKYRKLSVKCFKELGELN